MTSDRTHHSSPVSVRKERGDSTYEVNVIRQGESRSTSYVTNTDISESPVSVDLWRNSNLNVWKAENSWFESVGNNVSLSHIAELRDVYEVEECSARQDCTWVDRDNGYQGEDDRAHIQNLIKFLHGDEVNDL